MEDLLLFNRRNRKLVDYPYSYKQPVLECIKSAVLNVSKNNKRKETNEVYN